MTLAKQTNALLADLEAAVLRGDFTYSRREVTRDPNPQNHYEIERITVGPAYFELEVSEESLHSTMRVLTVVFRHPGPGWESDLCVPEETISRIFTHARDEEHTLFHYDAFVIAEVAAELRNRRLDG